MTIASMAAVVIGFLATGQIPYSGTDHLVIYLPETSLVRQAHLVTPRATGWFGFDNAVRRCCDELNSELDWHQSEKTSCYYQVQGALRAATMEPVAWEALDFYVTGNKITRLVKTILPDASQDIIFQEQHYIQNTLDQIRPRIYFTSKNRSGDTNIATGQNSL
jgi:hypothetical protein